MISRNARSDLTVWNSMMKRGLPAYRNKSEHVAEALIGRILEARLKPGDLLGTEAELLAKYDVSRPTLRESLRMLQAQGVVTLRPGPRGGVTVGSPSIDSLAHALSVFLYLRNVPFGAVLKAREVIEPALAYEAALNGTEQDFEEMAASIARMRLVADQDEFIRENRVFHEIVARVGRNDVLESFWSAISLLASGEQHGITYSFGNRIHVVDAHEEILRACRAREPAVAAARMAAHVGELEHLVRRRYRSLLDEPTRMMVKAAG
jgi:GntR family transcriptional regulator, transcriptional repressor for pyruvate dehydrogenase complex